MELRQPGEVSLDRVDVVIDGMWPSRKKDELELKQELAPPGQSAQGLPLGDFAQPNVRLSSYDAYDEHRPAWENT